MKRVLLAVPLVLLAATLVAWKLEVGPFGPRWVRIVTSHGEPSGAFLLLQRPGEPEPDFADASRSSEGRLAIPRDRIREGAEMTVIAPGCGVLRGELPEGERIVLPPAVRVTLRVPGDFPLPRPPATLSVAFEPADVGPRLQLAYASAVVDADYWKRDWLDRTPLSKLDVDPDTRSVDLLLPRPGRWTLRWSVVVREHEGVGVSGSGRGPAEGSTVEVAPGAREIVLPLTAAELDRFRR